MRKTTREALEAFASSVDDRGEFYTAQNESWSHRILVIPSVNIPGGFSLDTFYSPRSRSWPQVQHENRCAVISVPDNAHGPDVVDVLLNNYQDLEAIADSYLGAKSFKGAMCGDWKTDDRDRHLDNLEKQMKKVRIEWRADDFIDWWANGEEPFEAVEGINLQLVHIDEKGIERYVASVAEDADILIDAKEATKKFGKWVAEGLEDWFVDACGDISLALVHDDENELRYHLSKSEAEWIVRSVAVVETLDLLDRVPTLGDYEDWLVQATDFLKSKRLLEEAKLRQL